MAVLVAFTCAGCEDEPSFGPGDRDPVKDLSTEYIRVLPAGTSANVFNGDVMLDFPPGTVATPTRFAIAPIILDAVDLKGNNIMHCGISITNITNHNAFENPVKLIMRYDLAEYSNCQPGDESCLAIYRFYGDSHAFYKIECIGECCVNCSCKTIQGCIQECGSYVVGQN